MANQYLKDPVRVNVGSLDLQACHSVTQLIEFIETENKQARVYLTFNIFSFCLETLKKSSIRHKTLIQAQIKLYLKIFIGFSPTKKYEAYKIFFNF